MAKPPSTISGVEASPYSRHIHALDGLRGLAVLGVMASHLFPGNPAGGLILRALGITSVFGLAGVDLFFVLSGFLITGILYDSLADTGYFRKFYVRRCLRIFPLYYGVLFALFLLTPWLGIQWRGMQWPLLTYLQNTNLVMPLYNFHPAPGISLNHFWTLAVEEQFYLVWPLIVFLLRDRKKLLWACLLLSSGAFLLRLALVLHGTVYHTINRATPCRADTLLIGAALALLMRGRFHDATLRFARSAFVAVAAIGAAFNLVHHLIKGHSRWLPPFDATYFSLRYTLIALACAALIAWCLRPRSLPRLIFELPPLRFFGKYSYGLYVLHYIAMDRMLLTFGGWISHHTSSQLIGQLVPGLMVFVISVAAAYSSYHLYEKRFLHLKRFFNYTPPSPQPLPEAVSAA
jgi:peptidoglycan/LPS O-acetylase OafA/YrhL